MQISSASDLLPAIAIRLLELVEQFLDLAVVGLQQGDRVLRFVSAITLNSRLVWSEKPMTDVGCSSDNAS